MSMPEFNQWMLFYRDYPFCDFYRYHRPAALITKSNAGGEVNDYLDWLYPPQLPEGLSDVDLSVLKAFGIKK